MNNYKVVNCLATLKAEIIKLQNTINNDDADYNSLDGQYNKLENENAELKAEIISLFKRLNDANKQTIRERVKHYPKEYKEEARDYFHHNPQCEKLFFFMVGSSGVDEDGDVIGTLNVGADVIAEYDNV